jgi:hypothetical protein
MYNKPYHTKKGVELAGFTLGLPNHKLLIVHPLENGSSHRLGKVFPQISI